MSPPQERLSTWSPAERILCFGAVAVADAGEVCNEDKNVVLSAIAITTAESTTVLGSLIRRFYEPRMSTSSGMIAANRLNSS